MPDGPDQTTTPAPTPIPNAPPGPGAPVPISNATTGGIGSNITNQNDFLQQPPPGPGFRPPQPSLQQQDLIHSAIRGKAMSRLLGHDTEYSIDPNTGKTIATPHQRTPGEWGRAMVMGAMLGLAAGGKGAEGGSTGGFLGGLGRGASAAMQNQQQQDQQARAQAQQQYKNQLEAQKNQRDIQGFKTEETMRQATIAHENLETLKTQMQINQMGAATKYQAFKDEADNGNAKFSPYKAAGVTPMADGVSQQEQSDILKNNPNAASWDWEQTGVRTVLTKDSAGNPVSTYEPVYSAYDKNTTVPVTKEWLDSLKQSGMDKYYPGTTDKLRVGQQMTVTQYSALKGQQEQAQRQKFTNDDATLKNQKLQYEVMKERAQAERAVKDNKDATSLGTGLTAWNKQWDELKKKNPNATDADAFNALPPGQREAISNSLRGRYKDYETTILKALEDKGKATDEADQKEFQDIADHAKEEQQGLLQYMSAVNGAQKKTAPPASAVGNNTDQVVKNITGNSTVYNPNTLENEPTKKLDPKQAFSAIAASSGTWDQKLAAMKKAGVVVSYDDLVVQSQQTKTPIAEVVKHWEDQGIKVEKEPEIPLPAPPM